MSRQNTGPGEEGVSVGHDRTTENLSFTDTSDQSLKLETNKKEIIIILDDEDN